jgi:hypothetical protein
MNEIINFKQIMTEFNIEINRESGYSQSRFTNQIQTEYLLQLRIQPTTWSS